MDTTMIAVICLGALALVAGGFAPAGGGGKKPARRPAAATARSPARKGRALAGSAADPGDKRRKQVAETLKELERKAAQQKVRLTVKQMIEQAGLTLPVSRFWIISAVVAVLVAFMTYLKVGSPLIAAGAGFAAGMGLPRWVVLFLRARRQKSFLVEFANAIDIIVRGVKSGLPLNDCLRVIGQESPDPVGGEFRLMLENLRVGITLEDALKRFYDRMPVPEVNFFQIVLSIQQKAGGNLSEALGNLSGVLRDRKRLQGKIKALSSEAKSSATIIGALPVVMLGLVYSTSPDYIMPLFTERAGNLILIGCALWMGLGILVMKKMISFKV